MKLIINIPEDKYNDAKEGKWLWCYNHDLIQAVGNGVPLDKIKKEISKGSDVANYANEDYEQGWNESTIRALLIIEGCSKEERKMD